MCNDLRSKYGLCSYDGVDAIKYAVFENFAALCDTQVLCDIMIFTLHACLYAYICLCMCYAALVA